jgi:hypothetical protein
VGTTNEKTLNRNWMFPYVFLFSFLWEYSLVGILQIHSLQDQFYFEGPFDEIFISNIAFASFILALVCMVLCFLISILNSNAKGRDISPVLVDEFGDQGDEAGLVRTMDEEDSAVGHGEIRVLGKAKISYLAGLGVSCLW